MSNLLTPDVLGAVSSLTNYNDNLDKVEKSLGAQGYFVVTGLIPSIGTGLSVNVTAGTALVAGLITVSAGFAIGGLTPSTVNHLYLLQNGSGTSNTTGTPPALSTKLGTATTSGVAVTSVNVLRSSGRQTLVRHENQVAGDVGSMGSIDISDWNATAADGFQVSGTLPSGALPSNVFLKDSDQTLADGTDIAVGSTTGTKIATTNTQKLGFYGAVPIVQPAGTADLRLSLINLGLIGTGTLPLNLSGGALNAGTASFAGVVGGSGTAFSVKRFQLTFPSDADYTLAAGELDAWVIDVEAGVITTTRNIIVPATGSARYEVLNRNAQAVVLKTAGGTGITIAAARSRVVYFPTGVNAFAMTPNQDFTI